MRSGSTSEIRDLELFSYMSDEIFASLTRGAYIQTFPPQVELITEGDRADFLHIVVAGGVELFAGWNGRETSMATLRPISTFILAATIRDAPYLMSARTIEKSRVIMLPSDDVREVFDGDNNFARAVVAELARCYRAVVKNTKGLKLRTSLERLANYILSCRNKNDGASEFVLDVEKRLLASHLGMTPENLSRAIRALRPYGVEIEAANVRITNLPDLENLAKPTPLIDDAAF